MKQLRPKPSKKGMTFIELVLCLFILSVLASAAFPLVETSQRRERELELARELRTMREAIDRYYRSRLQVGAFRCEAEGYPPSLDELVRLRFLRRIPMDPMTGKPDWVTLSTSDEGGSKEEFRSDGANVFDVRSRSMQRSMRGRPYRLW